MKTLTGVDLAQGQDYTALVASVEGVNKALVEFTTVMEGALKPFTRLAWVFYWRQVHANFQLYGKTRPNGRPRRSGRRHRGMRSWRGWRGPYSGML